MNAEKKLKIVFTFSDMYTCNIF